MSCELHAVSLAGSATVRSGNVMNGRPWWMDGARRGPIGSEPARGEEHARLTPRHLDLDATGELDQVAVVGPRDERRDRLGVDDLAPVGAEEQRRIEPV